MAGSDRPTPGGTHSYIKLYANILDTVRPKLVLEWGPGPNTTMAIQSGAIVVSVEQKQQYILPPAYNYIPMLIPVADARYVRPCDFAVFDLFFVDSRRRQEILVNIRSVKKMEALVILHDSQRVRYQQAISLYDVIKQESGTVVLR